MRKLVATTRVSGFGEISKANSRFRACVKDSGELVPRYGKAKANYESKQQLNKLFNN